MSGPAPERVQTGVRMEKRMVKVLKALAELRDISLGRLLEDLVCDAFRGYKSFANADLDQVADLMRIYGLDLDAVRAARAEEGE